MRGKTREYGREGVKVEAKNPLFRNLSKKQVVWLSHSDRVVKLPKKLEIIASTYSCPIAAFSNIEQNIYAVQFHPEVVHTKNGEEILRNFVFGICKAKKSWSMQNLAKQLIGNLSYEIGNSKVLIGVSGGVDSLVAATLLHKATGDGLYCVFIDHGLLRKDEAEVCLKSEASSIS